MIFKKIICNLPIVILLGSSPITYAHKNEKEIINLNSFLKEFHKNPKKTMNRPIKKNLPLKENNNFKTLKENNNFKTLPEKDTISQKYFEKRDAIRKNLMKNGNIKHKNKDPLSSYIENDNPRYLVDNPESFVDNIYEIDSKNLAASALPFQPWSGSYWPFYLGSIAYRYGDLNSHSKDFHYYAKYIREYNTAEMLVSRGETNNLSPAEKYDLLLGDKKFTLTNSIINNILSQNSIEKWEGICDGWAPASYMYNRPIRSVKISNPEGTQITFYPSDIKALSSLLWAKLNYSNNFIGGRCNEYNPKVDENGRIISQNCFDTNPASFHLALINQIGINQKSFIIDATYDFEVWNQPVYSYSYYYFNPKTGTTSSRSNDVMINRSAYTNDKFRNYRSNNATYIVGVKTRMEFIAETQPNISQKDYPNNDAIMAVEYIYDLEIDSNGQIIGGEWYQSAHPDFMWTPTFETDVSTNAVPFYSGFPYIDNYYRYIWNENPTRPNSEWAYYSSFAASSYEVPLENIVRSLHAWSSVDSNDLYAPELCKQPCIPSIYKWHRYQ